MTEIIDVYSHIMTEPLLDELESVVGATKPRLYDVEGRLEVLDEFGIDKQVLTVMSGSFATSYGHDEALDVTRLANDEIRRLADEHPDRFVPVATVPYLTDEYVDEVERCVDDLDMAGIQITTNINGRLLDDEAFFPFFEAVDDAGVPIWLHPQLHDWHDYAYDETWIYRMLAWPFETSVAIARLVFFGVLDRFENVEILTHHLGGTLPYLEERMYSWVQTRTEEPEMYSDPKMPPLSEPAESYFDRIYGDTAVASRGKRGTLRTGLEFFGEDNVLFGADYPLGPDAGKYWMGNTISTLEEMPLPASTREKVLAGNARRLLDL